MTTARYQTARPNLFHAGTIDVAGLAVLAIAFTVALRSVTAAWRFSRS